LLQRHHITFQGNAPVLADATKFTDDVVAAGATVYYYYGTSCWSSTYGGLLTVELFAPQIDKGSIGVATRLVSRQAIIE
jgi:hypothetical protein